MIVEFADIEIDCERFELRRNGEISAVEPLILELIIYLAKHPNQLFSKDDLVKHIWNGRVVSDSTVSSAIKSARQCLGDDGKAQRYIQTVHGRGFRFKASADIANDLNIRQSSTIIDPSLILLPFKVLSGDQQSEKLVQSLSVSIETMLTRVPLLKISSASVLSEPLADSPRQIHEKFGN